MKRSTISVVIPAYREASCIKAAVRSAREVGDEVLVVDAASPDETAAIARQAGARVVQAPKGRGAQLRAGAAAARGDVLLFVHADTLLPDNARSAIFEALVDPTVVGGNFYVRYVPESRVARLFSLLSDLRRRCFRLYYGDSALFVRRAVYDRIGGFSTRPILEDYEFARRLERAGKTAYLRDAAVTVSARRFAESPGRVVLLWGGLQLLYSLGVPAEWLARFYGEVRPGSNLERG